MLDPSQDTSSCSAPSERKARRATVGGQSGGARPFPLQILKDDDAVSSLDLKPNSFFVCFVKPKAAAKAAPKPAEPVAPAAPAPPSEPAAPEAATPPAAPAPAVPAVAPAAADANPEHEATISGIMEMGFARDQVVRALRAAFNNADRAVEYLMNGIPEVASGADGDADVSGGGVGDAIGAAGELADEPIDIFAARGGDGGATGAGGLEALQELRNHPQLPTLRALLATQPALLPQVLQTLAQQSPQLVQVSRGLVSLGQRSAQQGALPLPVSRGNPGRIDVALLALLWARIVVGPGPAT